MILYLDGFGEQERFREILTTLANGPAKTGRPTARFRRFCETLLTFRLDPNADEDEGGPLMGHSLFSNEGFKNGKAPDVKRAVMLGSWKQVGNNGMVMKLLAGWLQVCRLVREANPGVDPAGLLFERVSTEFVDDLAKLFA